MLQAKQLLFDSSSNGLPLCYASPLDLPTPISLNYSCDPGFYCPNTTASILWSLPQVCPPTLECIESRLKGEYCPTQGPFEPMLCPAGYYCSDW